MSKSTKNWKLRRDAFTKHMGLSSSSKYISDMISSAEYFMKSWKDGETYDMLSEFNKITFRVITIILFGNDVNEKVGTLEYILNDGTTQNLLFADFFIKICKDLMANGQNLIQFFASYLAKKNLVKPYSVNIKNVHTLHKALKEYLAKLTDKDSVYYKLTEQEGLDKEEVFQDLIGFLFAGHETSSHSITSALYFLAKNPETKNKLLLEIRQLRGMSTSETKSYLTKERINNFEYLYCVIKETLRLDCPANETLPYVAVEDFTL